MRKLWFFMTAIGVLSLLTACSTLQPPRASEKTQLERQVTETSEKIEEISHKLSIIQFMVDDHQKTLKEIEAALEAGSIGTQIPTEAQAPASRPTLGKVPPDTADKKTLPVSGANADQLYKRALSVYKSGNYGKAATIFKSITENYPGHNLADNALYWTGECFYAQKNYKGAIRTFKKVVEKYPGGSKVPDALLKIGYSYLALGDKTNARSFLKKVVKQYPFTPAGTKAGEMLKRIKSK